jgi:hypothetical protein
MNKEEAVNIALESLWQVFRLRNRYPSFYHYITDNMDISDETFEEAVEKLHPENLKKEKEKIRSKRK